MPGRGFNFGAVLGRWLRRPVSPARSAAAPVPRFQFATIDAPSDACAAALALTGKRFLLADAPRLPLADCDRSRCACSLVHHEGRRSSDHPDARNRAAAGPIYTGPERRARRGAWRLDRDDEDDFDGIGRRTPAGDGDP